MNNQKNEQDFVTITINDLKNPEQEKWFVASQEFYKQYFPVESEALPREDIEYRIDKYTSLNDPIWYDLYGVVSHPIPDKNISKISNLKDYIIGLYYYQICLKGKNKGWVFCSYIAREKGYTGFFNFTQQKVKEFLNGCKTELKKIIFEVETVDFDFLSEISNNEDKTITPKIKDQMGRLQRLYLFLNQEKPNSFIILTEDGQPLPYKQPPLSDEGKAVDMFLMISPNQETTTRFPLAKQDVNNIIDFILQGVYKTNRINFEKPAYSAKLTGTKKSIMAKIKTNAFIAGKAQDIKLESDISVNELYKSLEQKYGRIRII